MLKDCIFCWGKKKKKKGALFLQIISVRASKVCYQERSPDIYRCPPIQFPYQIVERVRKQAVNF